jgi:hypothetical protein
MDEQHQDTEHGSAPDHKPLSCAGIADALKRNPVSVFRCIKRLKLEPELTTPAGFKFYPYAAIELVRKSMRAPNSNGHKVTSGAS